MKLDDIIALAKQGYKPSDIKEIISLAEEQKEDSKGTESTEESGAGDPEDTQPESTPSADDPKQNEIDYKKLYEDAQKKLDDIQKENVGKDISGGASEKSTQDILNEIAQSFM